MSSVGEKIEVLGIYYVNGNMIFWVRVWMMSLRFNNFEEVSALILPCNAIMSG